MHEDFQQEMQSAGLHLIWTHWGLVSPGKGSVLGGNKSQIVHEHQMEKMPLE